MEKIDIRAELTRLKRELPSFPDGRIDYHGAKTIVAVGVLIEYDGEFLLMKRSEKVGEGKGKWMGVAGYMDEIIPVREKMLAEIEEETGITRNQISLLRTVPPYSLRNEARKTTWIIQPGHAILKNKPEVKLDWEHTEMKWVKPEQIRTFDVIPSLLLTMNALNIGNSNNKAGT